MIEKKLRERLENRIIPYLKNITDNCILYPYVNTSKYGDVQYTYNKKKGHYLAHRLSYEMFNGIQLSSNQLILHSCDIPNCINPHHLRIGTHRENVRDRVDRKRSAVGMKNGRYIHGYNSIYAPQEKPKPEFEDLFSRSLDEDTAKIIKEKINNRGKKSLKKLSEELNIKYQTIRDISCGRTYMSI